MNAEKIHLAEMIDTWVLDIARHSNSDEQVDERILENMLDYRAPFKQLLDICTGLELNLLMQRYDGLYRFANLLERLAQAIQDGVIDVPEDAPLPPDRSEPPAKPDGKETTTQTAAQTPCEQTTADSPADQFSTDLYRTHPRPAGPNGRPHLPKTPRRGGAAPAACRLSATRSGAATSAIR